MLQRFLIEMYKIVPPRIKRVLGSSKILMPVRNALLRPGSSYLESSTRIVTQINNFSVDFWFYSTLKNIAKAQKKGIEKTLLSNSIALLKDRKNHNNDCLVLDIGANFGYLSLVWANSISQNKGTVVAFESNPNVYRSFLKSVEQNELFEIIKPINCAVGNANKTITIYLSETTSNIIKSKAVNSASAIEMITVDSFFNKNSFKQCDLIKIDVDGIELDILEGCAQTITMFKPIIIVETNDNFKIIEFFKSVNYEVLDMDLQPYSNNDVIPPNVFCVPL